MTSAYDDWKTGNGDGYFEDAAEWLEGANL